jgi:hypothetical protein
MTILGALIILFHPSEEQLARAVAMRSACDRLLVVDNSPLPDARAAMMLGEAGVALLHHGNRNGIAGAFNCGLSALFDEGVDAVALFDQDSEAPASYFTVMRERCASMSGRAFLAGPRIFDENDQRFLPELATSGLAVERLSICADAALQRCAFLISSGCVISREAFARLGRFDEALFIDHVDTEYCLRALLRNVPVYVVPSLFGIDDDESPRFPPLLQRAKRDAAGAAIRTTIAGGDRAERADALANRADRTAGKRQAGEAQGDCAGPCRWVLRANGPARADASAIRGQSG